MMYSIKVDEAAANFYRTLLDSKDEIEEFVRRFMQDLDNKVSSAESYYTMTQWQEFLVKSLGDISALTHEEVKDLYRVIRINRVDKCSMVTRALSQEYGDMKDIIESPLWDKYSLMLPRLEG